MRYERKYSAKREAILALLRSTDAHPGARWVYEQLNSRIPGLSLGTVYRNLNIFRLEGKALSLGVVRGEERFDGIVEPHPHLVCSCCGSVIDLPQDKADALLKAESLFTDDSFYVDFRKTVFYGLCGNCINDDDPDGAA